MLGSTGRNVNINIDRIDTCPETVLGLFSTCCCTLFIWFICIPLFDIGGMGWIIGWEGRHAILYPKALEGECINAMSARYTTPAQAFAAMDTDSSGDVNRPEFRAFTDQVNSFLSGQGLKTMRSMSCYQEYDINLDGSAFTGPEFYSIVGSKYHWEHSMSAVTLRKEFASKYGSMAWACDNIMDKNNDTVVSLTEFENATATLPKPPSPRNTVRLFEHMDTNSDGTMTMAECHLQVTAFKLRLKNTYGNLTHGCAVFDTNGDGQISRDEFDTNVKLLTPPISEADANGLFPKIAGEDKVISVRPECFVGLAEFKKRVAAAGTNPFFNSSDTNQDAVLNAGEFMASGARLVPPVGPIDMAEIWPDVDLNQDAVADLTEFGGSVAATTSQISGLATFVALVPENFTGATGGLNESWVRKALDSATVDNPADQAQVELAVERRLIELGNVLVPKIENGNVSVPEVASTDAPTAPSTSEASTCCPGSKALKDCSTCANGMGCYASEASAMRSDSCAMWLRGYEDECCEEGEAASTTEAASNADAATEKKSTTESPGASADTQAASTTEAASNADTASEDLNWINKQLKASITKAPGASADTEEDGSTASAETPAEATGSTEASGTEASTSAPATSNKEAGSTEASGTDASTPAPAASNEEAGSTEASGTDAATPAPDTATEAPDAPATLPPTPAPTPEPVYPADFCTNAGTRSGMRSVSVSMDYGVTVLAPARVQGSLTHLQHLGDTQSPEFTKFQSGLVTHGVCLQSVALSGPSACSGPGCLATTPPPTAAPASAAPVTAAPATEAPATEAPVTAAPVTAAPVTAAPVTAAPTVAPTLAATLAPTVAATEAVTAAAATTEEPVIVTTTPVSTEDVPLAADEVQGLTGQADATFVIGRIELYIEPLTGPLHPTGPQWPSDNAILTDQLSSVVKSVLAKPALFNSAVEITKGFAVAMPDNADGRHVTFDFQCQQAGGPRDAIRNIQSNAPTIKDSISVAAAGFAWQPDAQITDYMSMTYLLKASGKAIKQRSGTEFGSATSNDGSTAFRVKRLTPESMEKLIPGAATASKNADLSVQNSTAGDTQAVPR